MSEEYRIKPLEWRSLNVEGRKNEVADSVLGKWEIWQSPNGSTYIMKPCEYQGTVYEDSYDEAKAHMERAYRRRIAPALEPIPRPQRQQGRER